MRTIWKPIDGYSGMYWVSNKGQVKSYRWWRQRGIESKGKAYLLTPITNGWDHLFYRLYQDGVTRTVSIGKLMLTAFSGPPVGAKKWACHNDGNPRNNVLSNLRWDTNSANQMDRAKHGTSNSGSANGRSKLTELQVISIHKLIAAGNSQRKVAAAFGVDQSAISNIVRGRNWPQLLPTSLT